MTGSREGAVARAADGFDTGDFVAGLARLVAQPTQSQLIDAHLSLGSYFVYTIGPELRTLGFALDILDNPNPGVGPVLLATRHEGRDRPSILIYGHGDVVLGQAESWRSDLNPWTVTADGDRLYGRGTADNKGQHWTNIGGLRAVIAERGS
ncbi:MAG TPA: hypothetical protein DIT35_07905, partial [Rhodospirillaceae bacterium]|nr:hypothetical protein [Rhodospirillaceae bacterium]